jgi:hypothetical protein
VEEQAEEEEEYHLEIPQSYLKESCQIGFF